MVIPVALLFFLLAHQPIKAAWVPHHLVVHRASFVDISHLGVHTHANFLFFRLKNIDVPVIKEDKWHLRYRAVRVIPHCLLPTDEASLPPGFQWIVRSLGSGVPTDGSIDGKPGWSLSGDHYGHGSTLLRFSVPTRFANWVAHQESAVRRRYENRNNYWMEIIWEQRQN